MAHYLPANPELVRATLEMLERDLKAERAFYATLLSVQKLSTRSEAYDQLLEAVEDKANKIKKEIREVLYGTFELSR